jgi:hypothetical protein
MTRIEGYRGLRASGLLESQALDKTFFGKRGWQGYEWKRRKIFQSDYKENLLVVLDMSLDRTAHQEARKGSPERKPEILLISIRSGSAQTPRSPAILPARNLSCEFREPVLGVQGHSII